MRYLPAVDGLRTVAVLAVFAFHLQRSVLPGGFVGVDVFFVISGYLISAVLLSDIEGRGFSVARFYQRRIARIAPAFFVVLIATLIAAWPIYSAQDYASASLAASFTAASLANVKYMIMGSYFKISPDAQPLLHYWSLAVEEQFYIVFPFVLWAMMRWTRRPLAIAMALLLASLALCVVLTARNPVYAFYLLPTRAWELLAGVCLTLLRRDGRVLGQRLAGIAAAAGLALVALSFAVIREGPHFPGLIAVLPVAGTALILAAVEHPRLAFNRLLGSAPMVYVGKRSYSLYLWHWPVFSLVDYHYFASPDWMRLALKVGVTLAATWLSYRYVEQPARRYLNAPRRRWRGFAGFAAAVALIGAFGLWARNVGYLDAGRDSLATGGIHASQGRGTVALIGDSQAAMYAGPLAVRARAAGYDLHVLGRSAGNELPGEPDTTWPDVARYLAAARPQVVIIAQAWDGKLPPNAAPLRAAIAFVRQWGARVIVIAQPPQAPDAASRAGIRAGARAPYLEPPANLAARTVALDRLRAIVGDDVELVDTAPAFAARDGGIDAIAGNGRLNYQDAGHLSDTGVARVLPALDAAIARALRAAPAQ